MHRAKMGLCLPNPWYSSLFKYPCNTLFYNRSLSNLINIQRFKHYIKCARGSLYEDSLSFAAVSSRRDILGCWLSLHQMHIYNTDCSELRLPCFMYITRKLPGMNHTFLHCIGSDNGLAPNKPTNHYLNQWCPSLVTHICVFRPQCVNIFAHLPTILCSESSSTSIDTYDYWNKVNIAISRFFVIEANDISSHHENIFYNSHEYTISLRFRVKYNSVSCIM